MGRSGGVSRSVAQEAAGRAQSTDMKERGGRGKGERAHKKGAGVAAARAGTALRPLAPATTDADDADDADVDGDDAAGVDGDVDDKGEGDGKAVLAEGAAVCVMRALWATSGGVPGARSSAMSFLMAVPQRWKASTAASVPVSSALSTLSTTATALSTARPSRSSRNAMSTVLCSLPRANVQLNTWLHSLSSANSPRRSLHGASGVREERGREEERRRTSREGGGGTSGRGAVQRVR